jgi:plastocyanin
MLPESAKVTLPLSLLGLAAAVVYAFLGGDDTGLWLFAGLSAAAAVATAVLLPPRPADAVVTAGPARVREAVAPPPAGEGAWPVLVGIGATFVAVSFVYGSGWGIAGVLVMAAGGVGWLAQVSADRRGETVYIAPLSIPVLAAATIGSLMYFISRVLLAVSPHASTAVAIAVASGLLLVAVLLALRIDNLGSGAVIMVLALGAVAVVVAGIGGLSAGQRTEEHAEGVAADPNVAVVAKDVQFDTKKLELPANQSELLKFENRDPVFHNIGIYRDKDFTQALFNGTPVEHATIEYTTPQLAAGTYYFHCDFHPTMQGKVDVK